MSGPQATRPQAPAAPGVCGCCTGGPTEQASPTRDHRAGGVVGWSVLVGAAAVIALAALGERLGFLDAALERAPWPMAAVLVVGGWPVWAGVVRAARARRVTSHTLMTLGVLAAAGVGEWTSAVLIVLFMRFADWVESYTTGRSRAAIRALAGLAPATARLARDGAEVPVDQVRPGDRVVVRPGERVPVDGQVIEGNAPVDQAPVTGESVPVDKAAGDAVFAATICQAGALTIEATRTGADTTFARILHLVEGAEAHRAPVQRFADRFAAYYIPVVVAAATLTLVLTGEILRAVAVVVVACACAIVIATPVVVLAATATAARRGLVIKGGATLEQLARVDTLVVDKTGTLTFGRPQLTDTIALASSLDEGRLLALAGAAEHRSEHPLAAAIVSAANRRGLSLPVAEGFAAHPGQGVTATVDGHAVMVGSRALLARHDHTLEPWAEQAAAALEEQGKTVFFTAVDAALVGLIAVADTPRPNLAPALAELRGLGIRHTVMLTGDRPAPAAALAGRLGSVTGPSCCPTTSSPPCGACNAAGTW